MPLNDSFRHVLQPDLPLPKGMSRDQAFAYLATVRPKDAPEQEMRTYLEEDFKRFIYTFGLLDAQASGTCLELGANPYFMTMLLKRATALELTLANYFGDGPVEKGRRQEVVYEDAEEGLVEEALAYDHFNLETDTYPYADGAFGHVLCCEIIEHMTNDPMAALREIKRVLKPGGLLVMTTPNVARLENVVRLVLGMNLYDPFSGYGPYGRHNREYTRHELYLMLKHLGFTLEKAFTADVHRNVMAEQVEMKELKKIMDRQPHREHDLGQYLFLAARNTGPAEPGKPAFLYRNYGSGELVEVV